VTTPAEETEQPVVLLSARTWQRRLPRLTRDRKFAVVVSAAGGFALVNGLVGIGAHSVAGDEGFSLSTSLRPWSSLIRLSIHSETNAWFYAFVLKAWSLFGTGLAFLRLPSLFAFVATVVLTSLLARDLFGPRTGQITSVLIAVNGALLVYANQVRGYSLAVALVLAATMAFVAEVRCPTRRRLIAWIALVVIAAQTSLQAFVILPVHLIALLALPRSRRHWRRRLGVAAVGLVVVAPTAYSISGHNEGQSIATLNLGAIEDSLDPFIGHGARYGLAAFAVAGVAALVLLWTVWRTAWSEQRFAVTLLCAWMVAPFGFFLAASVVVVPTLLGRYVLLSAPAMCMAMALLLERLAGVDQRSTRAGRILSVGAVVALSAGAAYGSLAWHTDRKTDRWDQATAYVFDHGAPGDRLVVASDVNRLYFEYGRTQRTPSPEYPQPGFPAAPWGRYGTGEETYSSPTAAQFAPAVAGAQRLWVVIYNDHLAETVMRPRLASLAPAFRLVQLTHFPVNIDVFLYQRVS
jgi:hypothetical protein